MEIQFPMRSLGLGLPIDDLIDLSGAIDQLPERSRPVVSLDAQGWRLGEIAARSTSTTGKRIERFARV